MTQHELAGKNLCQCVNLHLLQYNRSKCCYLTKAFCFSGLDDEPTVSPPWLSHNLSLQSKTVCVCVCMFTHVIFEGNIDA